ncbi:hypothetical protein ALP33_101339 [Pseudomonas amygdali pv. lachrymans]|uniref:Uncharacterized protein n=1 Tax=Pseudomonas amygdali pv. lachrymans TaxID=53707 RepID=A0AB37R1J3_PSEAV|nr:Unknown protein sequence [Pseudomonas amygdali pv. lachrymans]KPC14387.1 Unknown protein sequence [Pseudomonas amygdali pv. lachrymans]RMM45983.1 hypothetical protein ALQ79_101291 [Pseudomonas amygdali pv. lachrymans]RMT15385.1 hypothetical protein ALP54_101230 [Pseudomonas amygdali pv. lachrymans]RMU13272.1 hypothetical protein ALP33_101339 [Pseudomonas amygdali pv. lachrymans]
MTIVAQFSRSGQILMVVLMLNGGAQQDSRQKNARHMAWH